MAALNSFYFSLDNVATCLADFNGTLIQPRFTMLEADGKVKQPSLISTFLVLFTLATCEPDHQVERQIKTKEQAQRKGLCWEEHQLHTTIILSTHYLLALLFWGHCPASFKAGTMTFYMTGMASLRKKAVTRLHLQFPDKKAKQLLVYQW